MDYRVNYYSRKIAAYLARKAEMVQHREVIREVAASVDGSWVYYVMLVMAGVIALLGLLTNSVAVVIGAMLISPLMGPMISSSLAFTIGDLSLARRAFKTLGLSVALTVAVSALVTVASPLKEPTAEILSRVRPNILDLLIATLSGVAGAIALCTKRNYLITSTGVAVATAVVPPLSVTGYALGTWQPVLALGGFLLFFSNFVAIILTSDLVFFILGFRTSHVEAPKYSYRTRLAVISTLLTLIAVPLVYTLGSDVAKIKDRKKIERVLKSGLDRDQESRLAGYQYRVQDDSLLVRATVNTLHFVGKPRQLEIEKELEQGLKRPVRLELEQIMVASGHRLQQDAAAVALGRDGGATVRERPEELALKVARLVAQTEQELQAALAPFPVSGVTIGFAGQGRPVLVSATLRRDYPLSADERVLLARQLEQSLGLPVSLSMAQSPMLPPLVFAEDGTLLPESRKELELVKRLPEGGSAFRFLVTGGRRRYKELRTLRHYLTRDLAIPQRLLATTQEPGEAAQVKLRVVRQLNAR